MTIISALENFMVNKTDYYMVENNEKSRRYIKKWRELEEVSFKELFNGECIEITVPIGDVQYYCRFRSDEINEDRITTFLKNKLN
jgi:hypothetical protein